MGHTTTIVRKGALIRAIDLYLDEPGQQQLDDIRSPKTMFEIGKDASIVGEGERHHAEVEFLGEHPTKSWWPSILNKKALMRCAYTRALEISLGHPHADSGRSRPVVTTWTDMPDKTPHFSMFIQQTRFEVHVHWLTAGAVNREEMAAGAPQNVATYFQDFWLVASAAEVDAEWAKYQSASGDNTYAAFPEPEIVQQDPVIKIMNLPAYGISATPTGQSGVTPAE